MNHWSLNAVDQQARGHGTQLRLALLGMPSERQSLDDNDIGMAATCREERSSRLRSGVDQVARENDSIKAAIKLQILDAPTHRLGVLDVGEHRRRLVNRRYVKAEPEELSCNPTRTTPEFKH